MLEKQRSKETGDDDLAFQMCKNRSQVLLIALMFVLITSTVLGHSYPLEHGKVYIDEEGFYSVSFYDDNGNLIWTYQFPRERELHVSVLDERLIRVSYWIGSPAWYEFFFDTVTYEFSPTYFNPSYTGQGTVMYREGDDNLIIRDIFDGNGFYIEITRNFSPTAVPSNTVIEFKPSGEGWLTGNRFRLTDPFRRTSPVGLVRNQPRLF